LKKYKYIFIDLDDTLWDFHANARLSLNDIFIERQLSKFFEDFDAFFNIYAKRNLELWDQYGKGEITQEYLIIERFRYPLAQMGLNDWELAKQIGDEYLRILPTKRTLIPFAKELLEYLKPNYPLTIISNGFYEVQHQKMQSSQLLSYFDHVVLSETAGALKPDPKIFEFALALNGASPAEVVMIGDSYEADIKGAMRAGIDQIYFPLDKSKQQKQLQCTHQINSLQELVAIL